MQFYIISSQGTSNSDEIPATWTSDGSAVDFQAFWSRPPHIGEALVLSHLEQEGWIGHWFAQNITTHDHAALCMRDALPGMPDSPAMGLTLVPQICEGTHFFNSFF